MGEGGVFYTVFVFIIVIMIDLKEIFPITLEVYVLKQIAC
jgi:hypothetical protein